ncbi:MAG: hypothetical protein EOM23_08295 [Candidatus Moranbacteria bacterium]|nr:hypothetical protein [Candidatus Moranbacteria bacterium]
MSSDICVSPCYGQIWKIIGIPQFYYFYRSFNTAKLFCNMTDHTVLTKLHPTDIAAVIESQRDNERLITFLMLHKDMKAEVFTYFTPTLQKEMIQNEKNPKIFNY